MHRAETSASTDAVSVGEEARQVPGQAERICRPVDDRT
jgi:hypothetical protein